MMMQAVAGLLLSLALLSAAAGPRHADDESIQERFNYHVLTESSTANPHFHMQCQ